MVSMTLCVEIFLDKSDCFFEEATKKIDEGRAVDVDYIDFNKPFDKVPHGKLFWKVRFPGIHSELANWIKHWFEGKSQRMDVEACSDWRPMTSGVLQRSMLGPLLSVIYVNNLDASVVNNVSKFADSIMNNNYIILWLTVLNILYMYTVKTI